MEFLLNRFRNLTVLLIVTVAQLLLIAYQVKTAKEVPLVRIWAVTVITPLERVLEVVRRNTWGFVESYFVLVHTREHNEKLQTQIGQLKLENQYLRSELSTADRVQALSAFQSRMPSKTLAARIIGNGTGANSKAVFVDRGSGGGVESGMAVVTPDGIVGKVVASYPTASLVLLITDANFGAGVISRNNHVRATLRGQGHDGTVRLDYVPNEEPVSVGDWFYTSGDDRIFPKGLPAGKVSSVRNGRNLKEIELTPSGLNNGLDEVLIVLEAVHQPIPEVDPASPVFKMASGPPNAEEDAPGQTSGPLMTDADKLKQQYRQVGEAEHHVFGQGAYGPPPDFTKMSGLRDNAAAAKPASAAPAPTTAAPTTTAATLAVDTLKTPPKPVPDTAKPGPATRTEVRQAEVQAEPQAAAPRSRPKLTAPLLITDPTDADPSEPAVPVPARRQDTALDEFGQPRQSSPAVKPKQPQNR